jgi:hypothetical protein
MSVISQASHTRVSVPIRLILSIRCYMPPPPADLRYNIGRTRHPLRAVAHSMRKFSPKFRILFTWYRLVTLATSGRVVQTFV